MSDAGSDDDLGPLIANLASTLRELEAEFEPRTESGLPRPPSPRELMRFTSDVAIPGAILVLRTNIEALKLLQRALRLADGRSPTTGGGAAEVRDRARQVSEVTLSRLDGALSDLQDAVEGSPGNDEARELLEEARELRSEVQSRLRESVEESDADRTDGDDGDDGPLEVDGEEVPDGLPDVADDAAASDVPIDVEAELRSIKEEVDGDGVGDVDGTGSDGDGAEPNEGGDDPTGDEADADGGGPSNAADAGERPDDSDDGADAKD